jgi:general stress protein YciG
MVRFFLSNFSASRDESIDVLAYDIRVLFFQLLNFNLMPKNQENQDRGNRGSQGNTSNRGFASMDPEKQREIASEGGRAAHEKGTAHEFDSEEARVAGRKGGEAVSQDREHMAEIGRKGGQSSGGNRRRQSENEEYN